MKCSETTLLTATEDLFDCGADCDNEFGPERLAEGPPCVWCAAGWPGPGPSGTMFQLSTHYALLCSSPNTVTITQ